MAVLKMLGTIARRMYISVRFFLIIEPYQTHTFVIIA
jgi:hypothetical protein